MLLIYLIKTLFFRILNFFRRWYFDGLLYVYGNTIWLIKELEKRWSIRVNLHYLFKPLYQERNIVGYALGFLYRGIKILFGGIIYFIIILLAFISYIVWALVPIYIVAKAVNPNL